MPRLDIIHDSVKIALTKVIVARLRLRLIIVNLETEEIVRWISQSHIAI
jgi:hypothetical protein